MTERLTLATSTGLPLMFLVIHVAVGVIALVAGFMAIGARKGGQLHRNSGLVFVITMIATGITAAGISVYEGKSAGGGVITAYLVFTAYTTLSPLRRGGRQLDIALMTLALVLSVLGYINAFTVLGMPGRQIEGVPAGMLFFLTTITFLAAVGDLRMIVARGIQGTRRIARHLWRMCFGLFIAMGSFVAQLVNMAFLPAPLRSLTTILVLAATPLVALLYWMWRVRLKKNLRGLLTVTAGPLLP